MTDESDLERVLKAAGPRDRVPPAIEAAAREQLRAEWRRIVAERRVGRRRLVAFSMAAGVAALAVGSWLVASRAAPSGEAAGTMVVARNEVRVRSSWLSGWEAVDTGATLMSGDAVETGPRGRAGVALPGGISARLDGDTRIRLASAERIVIERGALYVDSGAGHSAESKLQVDTPEGSVRHVGTQYEVRLDGAAVRLRVREGRVEWQSSSGRSEQGRAGEQLTIAAGGEVLRAASPTYGESWNWVAAAAPTIDIDGRPLVDVLAWASRELGCDVRYASEATREEAAAVVVHGSIAGLTPRQALDSVLATTTLRGILEGGRLTISGQAAE
jgi:ferric-dicitrate binding protein FerR (iron transport regulator)